MFQTDGKTLCEYCFSEIKKEPCPVCGYRKADFLRDPALLSPGSVLAGKYVIGAPLGKGGFGTTYLAYDLKRGACVAVKEYFPLGVAARTADQTTVASAREEDAPAFSVGMEKFFEEAKLVSRFNGNPNIVSVYEFFYENGTAYFSMEYLKGVELKKYLRLRGTRLTDGETLFLAEKLTDALLIAHSMNVLHRDISPDNIMLCDDGNVKLIDFGAARQVVAEQSKSLSVILKQGFAPLEQYQRHGKQGAWTDIYALGATLLFARTGELPDDPMTRLGSDEGFAENRFGMDEGLFSVLKTCVALRLEDRFQSVFELKQALSALAIEPEPLAPLDAKADPSAAAFLPVRSASKQSGASAIKKSAVRASKHTEGKAEKIGKKRGLFIGLGCGFAALAVAAVLLFGSKPGATPPRIRQTRSKPRM